MEDDSDTEKIANRVILGLEVFKVDDFRRNIAWSTTPDKEVLFFIAVSSKAKVSNDTIVVIFFPQDDVLRFEISVHDSFVMHVLKSFQECFHDSFDLSGSEFMFGLDFVVKLAALEKLDLDVDGILRLVDSIEPHEVFVVEFPVKFNFVDEGLLAIFLLVGALLRKSLDCIFFLVLVLYNQVNRGEIALSDFLYWFKQFVESALVQSWLQQVTPFY